MCCLLGGFNETITINTSCFLNKVEKAGGVFFDHAECQYEHEPTRDKQGS